MKDSRTELFKISSYELPNLIEISKRTFIDTFSKVNAKENIDSYVNSAFTREKLTAEIDNPFSSFYFATYEGNVAGYLKINLATAQSELKDTDSLEVERIYVLQEFQGKKIGKVLMDKAVAIASEKRLKYIWLGVWEKNLNAINFYKKIGFVPFSNHTFMLGNDKQTDLLMKLNLATT